MPASGETPALFILDLDSMHTSTVPGSENLFSPRWSPSGRYLAAVSADSSKLMLYDFQSRNWRPLAQGSFGNPEWFSDDTFLSVADVQSMSIVRNRVSNGATEPLANPQNEHAALTAVGIWTGLAPDGSLLTLRPNSPGGITTRTSRSRRTRRSHSRAIPSACAAELSSRSCMRCDEFAAIRLVSRLNAGAPAYRGQHSSVSLIKTNSINPRVPYAFVYAI